MIFSVLSFVFGILLVQQQAELPRIEWLFLVLIFLLVSILVKQWRFSCFLLGISWAFWIADQTLSQRLPETLAGKDFVITGKIIGLPQQDGRKVRFDFRVDEPKKFIPEKLRLSWYYPGQKILAGQTWRFNARLKPPHGNFNPGGFDYERWLFIQGIGAVGYVRDKPAPVLMSQTSFWRSISIWRQNIANQVDELSGNSSFSGLIKALIVGDRSSISQEQWQILRKTGTVHLIAISGLHIGLVAGMVYLLVLKLWARTGIMRWLPAKIAALAAITVAIFYTALAGFSIPTQRALVMLCVFMGSILLSRNIRPFNSLALAMLIVLLLDPLAVLSEGFWLSFIAVGVIIYSLGGRLKKSGYWQGAIKVHFATAISLSPLLVLFFQQTSLIAPLANLIAVPVVGFLIVPLSLISAVLFFIAPNAAKMLLSGIDFLFQRLWDALTVFADFSAAVWSTSQPSILAIVLAMAGIMLLLAPRGVPGRWLSACLLLPMVFPSTIELQPGEIKMALLDVGQGLSTVVYTANHVLVFDAGAKYSERFDSGESVVLPYLRYHHKDHINTLIISHGDNDHMGGADSIIKGRKVKKIITSVPEQFADYAPLTCKAGQSWRWDGVEFLMLSPKPVPFSNENDNSCVLLITAASGKILLTGDIQSEAEHWLVAHYGKKLQADVLIAPHHGSKTSSTMNFLRRVQASYVFIPAGYRNRYSFPHQQVVDRYKQLNMHSFNVAETGAITVTLGQKNLDIKTWRNQYGKYWNY